MSAPSGQFDAIVVGGGHNGLACAAFLARAGVRVLLLEANATLGGAATTRAFAPGFRVSAGAHLVHQLPAALARELELERHGLQWAAQGLSSAALAPTGSVVFDQGGGITGADLGADLQAYPEFMQRMRRLAAALNPTLEGVPPKFEDHGWRDRLGLAGLGWRLRRLGRRDLRELLRIAGMNAYDLLADNFGSPLLQGALGLDAVLGTNLGPRSPGTVMTLLCRLAAQHGAGARGIALPRGGVGALSEALAAAARAAGAELRTAQVVERVLVVDDRAAGVRLASGETIQARCVVSNLDPKASFLGLVGAEHLDAGFVRRAQRLRARGLAAKLHLALDAPPTFTGLPDAARGARLVIAPSLDHLERAYNHSKYRQYSAAPALEITLPTLHDATLAPAGKHVLSAIVQYAPYEIEGGWEQQRGRFTELAIDTLEACAPGLRSLVRASELLTPADMEREFRLGGGHWHHVDLALDEFFAVRPLPGATRHATPLPGFYLCGAGCHPGGGVMGIAGRNAARQVLAEEGLR